MVIDTSFPLPTFQTMAREDPLNRRVVEQMLVGVATRQYARSLDAFPTTMVAVGMPVGASTFMIPIGTIGIALCDVWNGLSLTQQFDS